MSEQNSEPGEPGESPSKTGGEYHPAPDESRDPRTPPPLPFARVQPGGMSHEINYRPVDPRWSGKSMAAQAGMGFVAWLAFVAIMWVSGAVTSDLPGPLIIVTLLAIFGGFVFFCVHIRMKYAWKGFIPGVLIGLGLTCLLPLGILAVMCANM